MGLHLPIVFLLVLIFNIQFHSFLISRMRQLLVRSASNIGRLMVGQIAKSRASSSASILPSSPATSAGDVLEPEAYTVDEKRRFVVRNIVNAISDKTSMLFAVIYIQKRQFKVIQEDIIHVHHNIPLDVGEEIKFEKVLLVGGADFTLIGRPLLDPALVHVRATVIEKTTTSPEVSYDFRRQSVHHPLWLSQELTVLRINNISVEEAIMGGE